MNSTNQGYESQNLGLPTHFQLVEGKITLTGGDRKVDNNLRMFLNFAGWFRIFKQDYCIDVYSFYQTTTSHIYQFRNVFRLKVLDAAEKHIPFAKMHSADLVSDASTRKEATLFLQYRYNLKAATNEVQTIKKIVI